MQNSSLSFTDPTGYIMEGGCIVDPSGGGAAAGALGGFTSVAATLWTRGLSFRIPIYFTVQWRSVSFSVGGSLGVDGSGDDRSHAGVSLPAVGDRGIRAADPGVVGVRAGGRAGTGAGSGGRVDDGLL